MSGTVWAAASGLGFGVFQTLNRRAVVAIDAYVSTFVQLAIATFVLAVAAAATEDLATLRDASAAAFAWFAAAGVIHFFGGWTFLNLSQKRIGAARTSPLVSIVPVFGVAVAAATIHEYPGRDTWLGMAVVLTGVYLVALERLREAAPATARWRDAAFGLATAACWASSPVLIKQGLRGLDSPLLGVTIGIACALVLYTVAIPLSGRALGVPVDGFLGWKLAAGVFVGLSVWSRWFALEDASVAVVLSLGLLSVPVVLVLSRPVLGPELERVTPRVVAGSALVVLGSIVLVALP